MNFSYWEYKEWFSNVDFTIIGSGIVGLNCALTLKQNYPKAKVLVLEKGILPQGASTKNAGFACFGSLSELIDDLHNHSEEEVLSLVKKRWEGLQLLRQNLGDKNIDFKPYKGYELFEDRQLYDQCLAKKQAINTLLYPVFNDEVFTSTPNRFGFKNITQNYIVNTFEGQLNPGKMMQELLKKVRGLGVTIINNITVSDFSDHKTGVAIHTNHIDFTTKQLYIATNGFANQLIAEPISPARAQVLITKPIENLTIKGTFHLDRGYYYFRNIDNRILLGGGRHLDFETEETTTFGRTAIIQHQLEALLKRTILPNIPFEIAHRWSGIMGIGPQKKSIIKTLSDNVCCGIRLGGMGVAIGSFVGKALAEVMPHKPL